jgi:hypothetical protein
MQHESYKDGIFLLIIVGCFLMLAGCGSTPRVIDSGKSVFETKQINFPELGVSTTLGLGDTLAAKGYKSFTPAIRFLEEQTITNRTSSVPRSWIRKGSSGKLVKKYRVIQSGIEISCYSVTREIDAHWNHGQARTIKTRGTSDVCEDAAGNFEFMRVFAGYEFVGSGNDFVPFNARLEEYTEVDVTNPSYVQELIYNGRVGRALKFVYREFSGDYMKPAFTQEVQYDLDQSEIIGFKKLRIKIISATNTEITYVLQNNF